MKRKALPSVDLIKGGDTTWPRPRQSLRFSQTLNLPAGCNEATRRLSGSIRRASTCIKRGSEVLLMLPDEIQEMARGIDTSM